MSRGMNHGICNHNLNDLPPLPQHDAFALDFGGCSAYAISLFAKSCNELSPKRIVGLSTMNLSCHR
jgi:hypothetical protein